MSNEPRSHRVIGEREHYVFGASGSPIFAEGMLPLPDVEDSEAWRDIIAPDLEVPLVQVDATNVSVQVAHEEDDIYAHKQYEEEYVAMNNGS